MRDEKDGVFRQQERAEYDPHFDIEEVDPHAPIDELSGTEYVTRRRRKSR